MRKRNRIRVSEKRCKRKVQEQETRIKFGQ